MRNIREILLFGGEGLLNDRKDYIKEGVLKHLLFEVSLENILRNVITF